MFVLPSLRAGTSLLVVLACAAGARADDTAWITPQDELPPWSAENAIQLALSVDDGASWLPQQYAVMPLTENLGGNESDPALGLVTINGDIKAALPASYNKINGREDIAYLSCDTSNDDFIQPNKMLNDLMRNKPMAIVLYSTSKNWCALTYDTPLTYTSILSMADPGEAGQVLNFLNGTDTGILIKAHISGNASGASPGSESSRGPDRSSVAMSILYTITGLVTLLFVAIIATGAVRAHRYPERYGPRGAAGGRPRQSRAKGIARAVLDTIPIVKFGNQQPSKPDPELELDTATMDGQDIATNRTVSSLSDERRGDVPAAGTASGAADVQSSPTLKESRAPDGASSSSAREEHLGCTICTEDFMVGEDVRVLPCSHQFHPNCVDPWLINVSGTCPLCRLDLRHGNVNPDNGPPADNVSALPPPLAWDGDDGDGEGASAPHRNRFSRIFDFNRLRQATREEQMETLRQIAAERRDETPADTDAEEGRQGARFADKLKEKFRIRTRAQSPQRQDS